MNLPRGLWFLMVSFAVFLYAEFMFAEAALATQTVPVEQCPKNYPATGVVLTKIPLGWRGDVVGQLENRSVGIFEGPPEQLGELVPQERQIHGRLVARYDHLSGVQKDDYWMVCSYGMLGEIRLYHRLPHGIKRCVVQYRKNLAPNNYLVDRIDCD